VPGRRYRQELGQSLDDSQYQCLEEKQSIHGRIPKGCILSAALA
jgi:hypothetical protein